jgi:hypothetical protein
MRGCAHGAARARVRPEIRKTPERERGAEPGLRLLRRVASILEASRIPYALVGAGAMAAHGVGRSTLDLDLLTTSSSVLSESFWKDLSSEGHRPDVRRGDAEDPLAGVVRFDAEGEPPVDLVVGRTAWQEGVLERAVRTDVGELSLPVATAADLILLKLYAGGSQDAWDVEQLLAAADDGVALVREVEARLADLPPESGALWARLREAGA